MRLFSKFLILFIFIGLAIVVGVNADIPPTPINLENTSGNFWVNHSWEEGTNANITNGYNVSINGEWHNTTNTFYNDTNLDPHNWSNITVFAYNDSGGG
ncbi:MAG: hypothetical protein K8R19_02985, partial [Methanosarcinales archaeon]|nr:hypothetical protein [Methanosarcinales archaeon]